MKESCNRSPFPFPRQLRWDYGHNEALLILALRMQKMDLLRKVTLVLPNYFHKHWYRRSDPDPVIAKPGLDNDVVSMCAMIDENINNHGYIPALLHAIDTRPKEPGVILIKLRKLGVWRMRFAHFNRNGKWELEDRESGEKPLYSLDGITQLFNEE